MSLIDRIINIIWPPKPGQSVPDARPENPPPMPRQAPYPVVNTNGYGPPH